MSELKTADLDFIKSKYVTQQRLRIAQLQAEMDDRYAERLLDYQNHLRQLERDKADFLRKNPGFPIQMVNLMFLNVTARPQRIEINLID